MILPGKRLETDTLLVRFKVVGRVGPNEYKTRPAHETGKKLIGDPKIPLKEGLRGGGRETGSFIGQLKVLPQANESPIIIEIRRRRDSGLTEERHQTRYGRV